jgi:hypothetical protein
MALVAVINGAGSVLLLPLAAGVALRAGLILRHGQTGRLPLPLEEAPAHPPELLGAETRKYFLAGIFRTLIALLALPPVTRIQIFKHFPAHLINPPVLPGLFGSQSGPAIWTLKLVAFLASLYRNGVATVRTVAVMLAVFVDLNLRHHITSNNSLSRIIRASLSSSVGMCHGS